jgi:hypothetical protein
MKTRQNFTKKKKNRRVTRRNTEFFVTYPVALKVSIPYCGIFEGSHHAAFNHSTRSRVLFGVSSVKLRVLRGEKFLCVYPVAGGEGWTLYMGPDGINGTRKI